MPQRLGSAETCPRQLALNPSMESKCLFDTCRELRGGPGPVSLDSFSSWGLSDASSFGRQTVIGKTCRNPGQSWFDISHRSRFSSKGLRLPRVSLRLPGSISNAHEINTGNGILFVLNMSRVDVARMYIERRFVGYCWIHLQLSEGKSNYTNQ